MAKAVMGVQSERYHRGRLLMTLLVEMYEAQDARSYSQIIQTIIQAIKKNRNKLIVKEYGEYGGSIVASPATINWDLIQLASIFKKYFGGIGSVFTVKPGDHVSLEPGEYKITKYIMQKEDFTVKVQKLGGKIWNKQLKIGLTDFLRRAGLR